MSLDFSKGYGLAVCVEPGCENIISNRDSQPCFPCWLRQVEESEAQASGDGPALLIDQPVGDRGFWDGVPKHRYNRTLRALVVRWRRRAAKS